MPLGWRYGLGLRLDPGPDRILGWEVVAADEQSATVAATSRLVTMTNTVELDGHDLVWTTTVDYRNRLGRALWQVARFSHEALMPLLIRRATRPD